MERKIWQFWKSLKAEKGGKVCFVQSVEKN